MRLLLTLVLLLLPACASIELVPGEFVRCSTPLPESAPPPIIRELPDWLIPAFCGTAPACTRYLKDSNQRVIYWSDWEGYIKHEKQHARCAFDPADQKQTYRWKR